MVALAVAGASAGEPAVSVRIDAALEDGGERIEGTVEISLVNDTGIPLETVSLWLYPERFRDPERGVTDRTVNWLYPDGPSSGGAGIESVSWNGEPLPDDALRRAPMPPGGVPADAPAIARVELPRALPPGARGLLSAGFSVEIPQRRSRFGRHDGAVMLAGGWFPRPLADLSGARPGLPPERIRVDVRLSLPAGRGAVLDDMVFEPAERRREISAEGMELDSLSLVVLDRMEIARRDLPWGEVIHVGREAPDPAPGWEDTGGIDENGLPRGLEAINRVDRVERALDLVERAAAMLRGSAPGCPLPERVVLVEVPTRDRLVQRGPEPLLLSDRIWRVVEAEQVLAFHDLALLREVGAALAAPAAAAADRGGDRYLAAEIVGARLARRYAREALGGKSSLRDLLGFAGFLPRIDNLLYSPQVPFREVYSPSPEEPDPFRDAPWRFMNRLPRGRRIQAKLEDLLGREESERLVADYLSGRSGLDRLLRRYLGDFAARFRAQWWGAYPSVGYRLGEVKDTPLPSGEVRHSAEVIREGAEIVEPVSVRFEDEDGRVGEVVWNGKGRRGEVSWCSPAPLERTVLDPHQRLVEDPALSGDHPIADNIEPLPWRPPLLTRLVIWGDAVAGEPHLGVGFAFRRQYDLTHSVHLSAHTDPRSYGASLSYLHHLGPKRTLNSRVWYLGPALGVTRYLDVEQAGAEIPERSLFEATTGWVGFSLGRSDIEYFWDPRQGTSFRLGASYAAGRADSGRAIHVGSASTRLFRLWTPRLGHTLALYGGLTAVAGDPAAADLPSLSDRQLLRGFALDESYGRLGAYLAAEYRHKIVDLAGCGVTTFIQFDRLQGALFAAGGTISRPAAGYDGLFSPGRVFTEVGYGLRLHTLSLGATQYLLALDIGVPITPLDRSYEMRRDDGTTVERTRPPWKLLFGITQTH